MTDDICPVRKWAFLVFGNPIVRPTVSNLYCCSFVRDSSVSLPVTAVVDDIPTSGKNKWAFFVLENPVVRLIMSVSILPCCSLVRD